MKSKWHLFASIFQLIFGLAGIISFAILALGGENMAKSVVALILSVAFVVLGIIGIIDYKSNK